MEIKIDLKTAKSRHPELVNKLLKDGKRKPLGKKREWFYSWGVRIEGSGGLADHIANPGKPKPVLTEDESVADYARRCRVALGVKSGRLHRSESLPEGSEVPIEILDQYRQGLKEDAAEKQRQANLSPEEQQKELDDLLKQLGKSGGFFGFRV